MPIESFRPQSGNLQFQNMGGFAVGANPPSVATFDSYERGLLWCGTSGGAGQFFPGTEFTQSFAGQSGGFGIAGGQNSRILLAHTSGGLRISDDFGATFTVPDATINVSFNSYGLVTNKKGIVVCAGQNTTNYAYSLDNGDTWTKSSLPGNTGTTSSNRQMLKYIPELDRFYCGMLTLGLAQSDDGVNWTSAINGVLSRVSVAYFQGQLYAALGNSNIGTLSGSGDFVSLGTKPIYNTTNNPGSVVLRSTEKYLFAYYQNGGIQFTSDGDKWYPMTLSMSGPGDEIQFIHEFDGEIYAATSSYFYKSFSNY